MQTLRYGEWHEGTYPSLTRKGRLTLDDERRFDKYESPIIVSNHSQATQKVQERGIGLEALVKNTRYALWSVRPRRGPKGRVCTLRRNS